MADPARRCPPCAVFHSSAPILGRHLPCNNTHRRQSWQTRHKMWISTRSLTGCSKVCGSAPRFVVAAAAAAAVVRRRAPVAAHSPPHPPTRRAPLQQPSPARQPWPRCRLTTTRTTKERCLRKNDCSFMQRTAGSPGRADWGMLASRPPTAAAAAAGDGCPVGQPGSHCTTPHSLVRAPIFGRLRGHRLACIIRFTALLWP